MQQRRTRRATVATLCVAAATVAVAGLATPTTAAPSTPPTITGNATVDALLAKMTLTDKVNMIEGEQEPAATNQFEAGYLPGVPRLGIPPLRLTDGPPGVITRQDSTGMTSTMGVAATWSAADAQANGKVIGRDARALGQDVVLEPFVNIDKDTSWGRGFNTFGEDPLLTSAMGANQITGIQSQGTMAQVKHFIGFDNTRSNNVQIDSQTLHELYLAPFDAAVKANVASVMCSYNLVNGTSACSNATTLTQVLRNELGFKGFVTADWGANHATTSLNAGLDMEMPGGGQNNSTLPRFFTVAQIQQALDNGTISMSRLNEAVGRVLVQYDRFGLLGRKSALSITAESTNANEKIVRQTATNSAVLLKNDSNALPLSNSALSSLAMIGPGAGQTFATNSGGEAAGGLLSQQPSALASLKKAAPQAQVDYAVADDLTGTPVPASALTYNGKPGVQQTDTTTSRSQRVAQINATTAAGAALPVGAHATWTTQLQVPSDGTYWLNLQMLGAGAELTVDGKNVAGESGVLRYGVIHPTDGNAPTATTDGLANYRASLALTAGSHTISITADGDVSGRPVQVRLAWVTPQQQQANRDAAIAAARTAQTAVVFAWQTGSGDLTKPLPDGQDQLIADIAAVNPNTVVVLQANQPVAMPWLGSVKGVLDAFYGGDQAGVAAADLLLGNANPSGHLPFTWPKDITQESTHDPAHPERLGNGVDVNGKPCPPSTTGANPNPGCTVQYTEGVNVGYRWYDATGQTPLFPFGYGLSYTQFTYSGLQRSVASDGGINVSVRVTNTGSRDGAAVPQVYLGAPQTPPIGVQFAPQALAGFAKVNVAAGQTQTVTMHIPVRQLQYWTDANGWTTATGKRSISVGSSARDFSLSASVNAS